MTYRTEQPSFSHLVERYDQKVLKENAIYRNQGNLVTAFVGVSILAALGSLGLTFWHSYALDAWSWTVFGGAAGLAVVSLVSLVAGLTCMAYSRTCASRATQGYDAIYEALYQIKEQRKLHEQSCNQQGLDYTDKMKKLLHQEEETLYRVAAVLDQLLLDNPQDYASVATLFIQQFEEMYEQKTDDKWVSKQMALWPLSLWQAWICLDRQERNKAPEILQSLSDDQLFALGHILSLTPEAPLSFLSDWSQAFLERKSLQTKRSEFSPEIAAYVLAEQLSSSQEGDVVDGIAGESGEEIVDFEEDAVAQNSRFAALDHLDETRHAPTMQQLNFVLQEQAQTEKSVYEHMRVLATAFEQDFQGISAALEASGVPQEVIQEMASSLLEAKMPMEWLAAQFEYISQLWKEKKYADALTLYVFVLESEGFKLYLEKLARLTNMYPALSEGSIDNGKVSVGQAASQGLWQYINASSGHFPQMRALNPGGSTGCMQDFWIRFVQRGPRLELFAKEIAKKSQAWSLSEIQTALEQAAKLIESSTKKTNEQTPEPPQEITRAKENNKWKEHKLQRVVSLASQIRKTQTALEKAEKELVAWREQYTQNPKKGAQLRQNYLTTKKILLSQRERLKNLLEEDFSAEEQKKTGFYQKRVQDLKNILLKEEAGYALPPAFRLGKKMKRVGNIPQFISHLEAQIGSFS